MWEPEAGWRRLPGAGPSTVGVWHTVWDGREAAVKRLRTPDPHDTPELRDRTHPAYWRREADVALAGLGRSTRGLRAPEVLDVLEDDAGITVVHAWVEPVDNPGLFLARSLGRFAAEVTAPAPWMARDQLARRLEQVARRGGWRTLARTPVADWADHLWRHRARYLERLHGLPQVLQHGDPVPGNLLGRDGEEVLAIDWSTCGAGPVGGDLGYLSLSTRESLDPLVEAYVDGLPFPVQATEARYAARAVAAFTVLTRADWALSRVVGGAGALAGKYRHPSVAPYVRAMQRQLADIEALVKGRD